VINILWSDKFWRFSAAVLLGWTSSFATSISPSFAQSNIAPDETLGTRESSQVTPNFNSTPNEVITGGAQRQQNLFHSFREFNVSENRGAYFLVPNANIQNILVRVTGSNRSDIFGVLGTRQAGNFASSNANLFLMNPNGIVFGENARLDLGGSFVGTTANAIQFGEQGFYSASGGQPADVLTINPSAFLFNQIARGNITNRSVAPAGQNLSGENITGLRVADGKSLLLLGGNVNIEGGGLRAYNGRIELAGLAQEGIVALNIAGDSLSFNVPDGIPRGDLSITNGAEVNVRGSGGGDIVFIARDVNISGVSIVRAGIDKGFGTPETKGGNIQINATGRVNLTDNATRITNVVDERAFGKAGDINIKTGTLSVTDDAYVVGSSFGQGDAGNIFISASDAVSISNNGFIGSTVQTGSVGNGGNINITANSLSIKDGGTLDVSTFGNGNAGNIFLKVSDGISFVDAIVDSNVETGAVGNGGNINIEAGSVSLLEGTQIQTIVRRARNNLPGGKGNGGNINVDVRGAINIAGVKNEIPSAFVSRVGEGANGNAGNITIKANSFSLTDSSQLDASTFGSGNAGNIFLKVNDAISLFGGIVASNVEAGAVGNGGNINIEAGSLSLLEGIQIQTVVSRARNNLASGGKGNGGNINVDVRDAVNVAGIKNEIPSGFRSSVGTGANGNGGNITIKSNSFSLTDSSELDASTFGKGNAGNVLIQASDNVSLVGTAIRSNVEVGAVGNGGDINIQADSLSLTNSARILAAINASGDSTSPSKINGGNINIDVKGKVTFANPLPEILNGISTQVATGVTGNGGNVTINAGSLEVTDGSEIQASTFGNGNSGTITINARDTINFDGSRGDNETPSRIINAVQPGAEGNAGGLRITTGFLSLNNGAAFSSSNSGKGNPGSIFINARDTISIDNNSNINNSVFQEGEGRAGDIQVTAGSLFLTNGSRLSNNVSGKAEGGNITIEARDTVKLDGNFGINGITRAISGISSDLLGGIGKAGNIQVNTGSLFVLNGAQLSSSTNGQGDAGNITINARDIVSFEGFGGKSDFSSTATSTVVGDGTGNAGNISINARALFLKNGGQVNASSFANGGGGNIFINTTDTISIDSSDKQTAILTFISGNTGKGGNIQLTTGSLFLTNGGLITTSGEGNLGNITINARDAIKLDGVDKTISGWISTELLAGKPGKAGDIRVTTGSLSLTNGAQIRALTTGQGNGGDITIEARDTVTINGIASNGNVRSGGISNVVSPGAIGKGGNLRLSARRLSLNNNAFILTSTLGQGDAGDIFLNVSEDVSLSNSSFIDSSVLPAGLGQGGNLDIETRNLTLTNGSQIRALVSRSALLENRLLPAGRGKGGRIRINASDSVNLSGIGSTGFSSAIATLTERGASGDAGDISLTTRNFRATDGAGLSAATFNESKGGDITINADIFELFNGTQVLTNTRSGGNAGTIRLNVKDRITITGSDPNFNQRLALVREELNKPDSTDQLTDVVTNEGPSSGLFANTAPGSTGNSGSIIIDPRQITVKDGGRISVNSEGSGTTGNIFIQGDNLSLENDGAITARAASRNGGDINLNLANLLVLRGNSEISTTAGTAGAGGDGGNININSKFVVAVPKENSDITANAFEGNGGRVQINTQGIFGIEFRPQETEASDITASSRFGISGVANINSPDNSFIPNNLTELNKDVINTNDIIANSCIARDRKSGTFFIKGSGGLPARPGDTPLAAYPTGQVSNLPETQQSDKSPPSSNRPWKIGDPIVEPQGMYQLPDGQIIMSNECPNLKPE
jgi:filamentous hemagglutinin family protein